MTENAGRGKKGFADDLLGAYSTDESGNELTGAESLSLGESRSAPSVRLSREFEEAGEAETGGNSHVDIKHDKYNIDNVDITPGRKRGRPKVTWRETRSKNFNLLMEPSTFEAIGRIAARQWQETGKKTSVTDVINAILKDYLAGHEAARGGAGAAGKEQA